ncbi:hypothetical protein RhiirA5_428025 [Rhizophagus irregularis]|uniref:Uncharacterized protein n=1 Tax=Rhizophagus irregularis TaxID=588596 RepID=A0A2N0P132_9GLOM|nr:hypothetical protein RhiirA5_428025 [Rhizophagus irregularis]
MALLKESINKVLSDDLNVNEAANQRPEFEEPILDVASTKSNIMTTEGLVRELTRGLINENGSEYVRLRKKKGVKGSSDEGERDLDNIENIEKQKKE